MNTQSATPVAPSTPAAPFASTLRVRLREVYGKPAIYPVCKQSKALAEIAGTKTLTPHALNVARRMGFTVECEEVRV